MSGSTVLIVDDERTLARAIKAFLAESGYEAEVAGDAEQALRLLETMRPDVVFSDVRLPGMDGIEQAQRRLRVARHCGLVARFGQEGLDGAREGALVVDDEHGGAAHAAPSAGRRSRTVVPSPGRLAISSRPPFCSM